MTQGHLLFAAVTAAYIFIAVKMFEKRDLLREFPQRYGNYMDQVSGFIPTGKYTGPSPSATEKVSTSGAS